MVKKIMEEELFKAFPTLINRELSDEYIREHTDLMWDIPNIPLIKAVPLYMLWCVENTSEEGELVFSDTISALNKYARAKDPNNKSQDFMYCCNQKQVDVVRQFLLWCKSDLLLDYEPTLSRAIKNWQAVNQ